MQPSRSLSDAVLVGIGARTPHGLTPLQVTMSVRAQKFAPRESHLVDQKGKPMATGRLASLADNLMGQDRFVALAAPTLLQATYPWQAALAELRYDPIGLPVFVALPDESRPGLDPQLRNHLLPALAARTRLPLDLKQSALFFGCRGGGIAAIEAGLEMITSGRAEAALVGGVDSYFDPDCLEHLDNERRLHGPDTENGFIPGEGAGFLLFVSRRMAMSSLERYGHVLSAAVELEPNPYGSELPCLGEGMARALRRAIAEAGLPPESLAWALSDVVNERHRVDEWMYALARNHTSLSADIVHDQPLLSTGDLGAASAAVLLAIAAVSWKTGCAVASTALIATFSDGAERGALIATREA